jgi:uncharacterized alpha-E superfamily protein
MGRRLERATNLVTLLKETLAGSVLPEREGPLLEAVLEVADSSITYRRRYLSSLQPAPVVDLLLMDETTPRSVAFQLVALGEHLTRLPRDPGRSGLTVEDRLVQASLSRLRLADVEAICLPDPQNEGKRTALATLLGELARDLPALSEALSGSYLNHATLSRQLAEEPTRGVPRPG